MHIYAEIWSCFDVVKVELHEGDLQGVGHGLHQRRGGGGHGPEHAGHPGCTRSHRDLLPLKLSSVGYLVKRNQTSVVMNYRDNNCLCPL